MSGSVGQNRAPFTLSEVCAATHGTLSGAANAPIGTDGAQTVTGIVTDSRAIESGNLFVALVGEKFDGHRFLAQVAAQGAGAALVSAATDISLPLVTVPDTLNALGDLARYHRQRFNIPVVGVTGSYGKTITRSLIAQALRAKYEVLASEGNFNNEIGLPLTLLQLEAHHQAAVLEMGMRGLGQIAYLAQVAQPTIGVITNIGPQHIELLETEENIARAKGELLQGLPADGLAVLPADSRYLPLLQGLCPGRFVTFGLAQGADYRATQVRTDEEGNTVFDLEYAGVVRRNIRVPLIGAHNAVNASAALAVAHQLGVSVDDAVWRLEAVQVPGARLRVLKLGDMTVLDDVYNAGPDSMRAALETLRTFPGAQRRVAILGAMRELGATTERYHREIGALAGEVCDVVWGVGEEARDLVSAVDATATKTEWFATAQDAMSAVAALPRRGDVILVKGSRSVGLELLVDGLKAVAEVTRESD